MRLWFPGGVEAGEMAVTAGGVSADVAWWRAQGGGASFDAGEARERLGRLRAWKDQYDADRARQPGPFLLMVWDGIFGDEDEAVCAAIREIEVALDRP